ncbi:gluconate:H+ symporter [Parasediminibacterium paludis]|uniref:Gluconate:H+ symporter n=1 Tax=Parasediminibacterium paludis TaxID=908966 RepID=A0ABV8PWB5_9BACT
MLLILLASLLLLILCIAVLKVNPFIAFLIVSIITGLLLGIKPSDLAATLQKGIGDMLGSIIIIICIGAMVGKLVAESGAAQVIANTMVRLFGKRYLLWGLVCTGFIIGIPLFYNVGFVLAIPIIFALVYQYKLPAVYVGLPMMAALSVAHGFLPPHPSPAALVTIFHASMGQTLLYGIAIAIPTIIIAGPLFAQTLKKIQPISNSQTFTPNELPSRLPSVANSFISALLPVGLLAITSIVGLLVPPTAPIASYAKLISEPPMVMLITLIVVSITLGKSQGHSMGHLLHLFETGVKDIAMIVLIIGGSGALKQVLIDSGASQQIAQIFTTWQVHPLVLGWCIAATIRVSLGSATVAGLTTAGILAPLMASFHVSPALMVLAIGSGSLFFSHVNDPGFWMFKEYFHLSLKDTFRSWSLMETIVSVVGLIGVMVIQACIYR